MTTEPIHVPIAQIPTIGLRVLARRGECFDDEIEWQQAEEVLLVKSNACNPKGESGVELNPLDDSEGGWGFAGFESGTKIWWRYGDEVKAGTYREHCMQILAVL